MLESKCDFVAYRLEIWWQRRRMCFFCDVIKNFHHRHLKRKILSSGKHIVLAIVGTMFLSSTAWLYSLSHARKSLTSCSKSANNKPSTNCFRTACPKLSTSLEQAVNNPVDIIKFVARLFQQVRYSRDITILLQPCVVNLVTFLLYHDCIRLVRTTL